MPNKKYTIHVPFECSLIECKGKDCNMKFILHAIMIPEKPDDDECDYEREDTIMPQSAVYYCPYCGEKQAKNK